MVRVSNFQRYNLVQALSKFFDEEEPTSDSLFVRHTRRGIMHLNVKWSSQSESQLNERGRQIVLGIKNELEK